MTVTNEGLRIELLESANGTFFDRGSPKPNVDGQDTLITLAEELGDLPNKIYVEGHTDSEPYGENSNYTNWELFSDRANAARKIMQQHGLGPDQVTQVRGYPDQILRDPTNPLDLSNRRITVIVQYRIKQPDEKSDEAPAGEEKPGEGKNPRRKAKRRNNSEP